MENLDSYLFIFKKIIGGLLMPLPIVLLLLLWALLLLLRRKTRWWGVLFVALAATILAATSYPPLVANYAGPLEQEYPSYQQSGPPLDYVSVLGHGHVSNADQPVTSEVSATGVVRLAEGIRIYRLNPGSKLILTGYKHSDEVAYADKLKQLAIALGVPEQDILSFDGPKDTAEEAALIAAQFAGSRLALVTSANHMPRAMQLFQQAGFKPLPAPTNHRIRPVKSKWLFPSGNTLSKTEAWLHELLGVIWAEVTAKSTNKPTGKVPAAAPAQLPDVAAQEVAEAPDPEPAPLPEPVEK